MSDSESSSGGEPLADGVVDDSHDEFADALDFGQSEFAQDGEFHAAMMAAVGAGSSNGRVEAPIEEATTVLRGDRSRARSPNRQNLLLTFDSRIPDYPAEIGNDFQSRGGVRDVMHARNRSGGGAEAPSNGFSTPSPHDIAPDTQMYGSPAKALRSQRASKKSTKPKRALPPAPLPDKSNLSLPLDSMRNGNRASSASTAYEGKTSSHEGGVAASGWQARGSHSRPRLHSKDLPPRKELPVPSGRSRKRPSPSTNERRSGAGNDGGALVDETTVKKLAKLHMQKRSAQQRDSVQLARENGAEGAGLFPVEDKHAPFPTFGEIDLDGGSSKPTLGGGGGPSMFSAARRRKRRAARKLGRASSSSGGFGMSLSIPNSNKRTPPSSPREADETAAFESAAAAAAAAAALEGGSSSASKPSNNDSTYAIDAQGSLHVQGFELNESGIRRAPETEGILQPFFLQTRLLRLDMLGRGASGSVYKAIHLPTLRLVAVKVIPVYEAAKRRQMISELKVLYKNLVPLDKKKPSAAPAISEGASPAGGSAAGSPPAPKGGGRAVACPFMVGFYDAFITPDDGTVSIVMEFMNGGSLQDIVDNGGCQSEKVLANISARVLHGLAFIHESHQIHRDIKPSNLLINHFGEVKISDFGTVRELEDTMAKAKTFVGTLLYMSPERMRAEPYTYKSDIWSFGVSLLSCAQGEFPFPETASYWELLEEVSKGELDLPAHFSANFRDFLRLALKKRASDRPSARQLLRHPWLKSQSLKALAADQEEAAAAGSNDGSDTARNHLDEICDTVMGKYLEYAANKLQQRLPLDQALIRPLDKSRLHGLSRQLGLSDHIVHMKFENKRLKLNNELRERYVHGPTSHRAA
eukprot:INCI5904.1.p1 GENE.INCI5904.1~~INCI5904.1.p1  ORF type:complete len:866 (-),score=169.27 INCI5904.1:1844-4441(-)